MFSTKLRGIGLGAEIFSTFSPYPGDQSGVTLASGFTDFSTGRNSIVTAPGEGATAEIKLWVYTLFTPIAGAEANRAGRHPQARQ